jgi:hypothetical protein
VSAHVPALESAAPSAHLDGQVLALSYSLWLAHFLLMVSRDFPDGMYGDAGTTVARLLTALAGGSICYALYLVLRRTPARRGSLATFFRALVYGLPACALATFVNELAFSRLSANYIAHPELFLDRAELVLTFSFFLWIFVAWAALYTILCNAQEMREQERRIAAATNAANAAQLRALQLQIHPHFLFNTLNALSGLIGLARTADAERTILNLSAFLRHTLSTPPDRLVPLRTELDAQRLYLDIEGIRFADRLGVVLAVDDECAEALTPALILQPLVENAVKHALSHSEGRVTVTIGARRERDTLSLWVRDERECASAETVAGLGIGLANVRERLAVLFGARATLTTRADAHGWTSTISLPWMTAG